MVSRRSFTEASGLLGIAFFYADTGQYAEALGFDEDLAFLTFFGTDLCRRKRHRHEGTIRRPSRALRIACYHVVNALLWLGLGFFCVAQIASQSSAYSLPYLTNMPAIKTDSATGPSAGPKVWKDSPGVVGEAVQVQAVVPVGAADQRQAREVL